LNSREIFHNSRTAGKLRIAGAPSPVERASGQEGQARMTAEGDESSRKRLAALTGGAPILVVEDVAPIRLLVTRQLASLGLAADAAENGEVGLDRLANGRYALALVDLVMPVADGFELARRRRKAEADDPRLKRIPLIALTARVYESEVAKCREAGFDGCLSKPLDLEQFSAVVERCLSGAAPERD
jgi:CheY-like chemotaxis protein